MPRLADALTISVFELPQRGSLLDRAADPESAIRRSAVLAW